MTKERLSELLGAARIEQKELCEATGVSEASISRYVNGSRSIPDDFAESAERFLKAKSIEHAHTALQSAMK